MRLSFVADSKNMKRTAVRKPATECKQAKMPLPWGCGMVVSPKFYNLQKHWCKHFLILTAFSKIYIVSVPWNSLMYMAFSHPQFCPTFNRTLSLTTGLCTLLMGYFYAIFSQRLCILNGRSLNWQSTVLKFFSLLDDLNNSHLVSNFEKKNETINIFYSSPSWVVIILQADLIPCDEMQSWRHHKRQLRRFRQQFCQRYVPHVYWINHRHRQFVNNKVLFRL